MASTALMYEVQAMYGVRSHARSHLLAHERVSAQLAARCFDLVMGLFETTEPLRRYLDQLPSTLSCANPCHLGLTLPRHRRSVCNTV